MIARAVCLVAFLALALPACAAPQEQAPQGDAFDHALTLVEVLMGIAARSENPERDMDAVLAGQRPEVNEALAGLLKEATAGMSVEQRSRIAAIGKDFAVAARKHSAQAGATAPSEALQARKDLTAMGLRYYDPNDFLEAVRRDDVLAVELFIAARGVNLDAKDAQGRTALDIARARGNAEMTALLSRSLRAAR